MNKLLHTPLTVHNVELANRLVMPPMATGKTPDGTVQDDLLAYYDARSKGGCIGLIVTEHAYISPEGKAHEGQLSVSRDTDIPGLTTPPSSRRSTTRAARQWRKSPAIRQSVRASRHSRSMHAKAKSPCAK